MGKRFKASNLAVMLFFFMSFLSVAGFSAPEVASAAATVGVQYQAHVQNIGWQAAVADGATAGTSGLSYRVEALKINLVNAPAGAHITYQAHVQNIGWQSPVSDGAVAGTSGLSYRVEAIKISLENMPGYSVQYQAHVQNLGWQDWVSDGQVAGTSGQSLRVEAIRIRIVPAAAKPLGVQYQAHVQNIGWQAAVADGATAGTSGLSYRVEALKINLVNAPAGAHIKYQAHVQNIGWQAPVEDGAAAGTSGLSYRVEAIRISLENMPGYSVQYQAHVQNIGWQNWVSDGQIAGTSGLSYRVEAIRIRIVPAAVSSLTSGSTAGNTLNSSFAEYDGSNIYYLSSGTFDLHSVKADGTNDVKIADGPLANINISGDYIYFSGGIANSGIYKVKKDGTGLTKLNDNNTFFMTLMGDWIYYFRSAAAEGGYGELWKIKTDGTSDAKVMLGATDNYTPEYGYSLVSYNGYLYFDAYTKTTPVQAVFVKVSPDGMTVSPVSDMKENFVPEGDYVYYTDANGISKVKQDGTGAVLVNGDQYTNGAIYAINISGGYIYYSVASTGGDSPDVGIYRIALDGSGKVKLTGQIARDLSIADGWIYYYDGTNIQKISAAPVE